MATALAGSSIFRDIQQEERRKKCLELVDKGKVPPTFCTQLDEKGVIEDIRKTIDEAGKLALAGGALYLLGKLVDGGKR
ncbi:MAG: hypothetical protein DSY42_09585 [Aquifex sp.]|nr:MAG: hypothetical protein DSY42_09585 [Aquifex sp.]